MNLKASLSRDSASSSAPPAASEKSAATATVAALRFAAMNLLAMREHSQLELERKLLKRFGPTEAITIALSQLKEEGLQSDTRFAEHFIIARARRGQGPVRIRQELQERGLDKATITEYLEAADVDWSVLVREVVDKKFGNPGLDGKTKAKQMRFLQYRGFTHEQIQALWRPVEY